MVEFINKKMDLVRLCDLLNFQLTRLLFIQSTDGVFLNQLCWFTALKWLLEKKDHEFNKEQAHTQATNMRCVSPAPKEKKRKKKVVFKPNHQNICMPTMHVQWSWNRNAVGKPAISDTRTKLIEFPWNILLWVRKMTVIHTLLLQKCCLGRLVYLFYNKDSSHLWNSDFSLINTNKHKII